MRLGLFGGTFDPIHIGHLDVARAAHSALQLDEIWLVPSQAPPHRHGTQASAAHRFAMVALAIVGDDRLLVSDLEMNTVGPSYTNDTLDRLEASGVDMRGVVFITGADAFRDIESWRFFPRVLNRCDFAVVSRPGVPAGSLRSMLPALADRMIDAPYTRSQGPGIFLIDAVTSPVSSTDVRRRARGGGPLEGLVPSEVAGYITRQRLYRTADATEG
jgi:nicotinate-nucleotide adenylyltransferase